MVIVVRYPRNQVAFGATLGPPRGFSSIGLGVDSGCSIAGTLTSSDRVVHVTLDVIVCSVK